MARILMTLLGLGFLALGVWAGYAWWPAVLQVLQALLVFFLILFGLALLIFGISEIAGNRAKAGPADGETKAGE
ncbi:MAG: hypothetical protein BWY76_01868 [bacterium ADurb.Bin429]|nr:MAG: hypothetical protein BWY76_01868 [bacterium ADurb.Bin429]